MVTWLITVLFAQNLCIMKIKKAPKAYMILTKSVQAWFLETLDLFFELQSWMVLPLLSALAREQLWPVLAECWATDWSSWLLADFLPLVALATLVFFV